MSSSSPHISPIPQSFWQYVQSLGPGIVVALTWLGAGDLVNAAVAGGTYGYTLMWAMGLAVFVRFVLVSIIAKYQLCNQHGESVLAGLKRVHAKLPVLIALVSLFFCHLFGAYTIKGLGETTVRFLHGLGMWQAAPAIPLGESLWPFFWSCVWVTLAAVIVLRGLFQHIEIVFYCLLGILSLSLISIAVWSGPQPLEAAKGLFLFSVPAQTGSFGTLLLVTALIGAVGGSTANLLYPYFIQQKGWRGPRFRRVQMYDLLFGILVLLLLDLSVWVVGAELLKPRGILIEDLAGLARLLTEALGSLGEPLFFLGVFAAMYSSIIGVAVGYGYMWNDLVQISQPQTRPGDTPVQTSTHTAKTRGYYGVVVWCLFSPLIWALPHMPSFIFLTLVSSAVGVLMLPILSGSLWYITASTHCIGARFRNRLWENLLMAALLVLAVWGAYQSGQEIFRLL